MFILLILGATHGRAPGDFAGLTVACVSRSFTWSHSSDEHVGKPVARSTGPALYVRGSRTSAVMALRTAPLIGAALAGSLSARGVSGRFGRPLIGGSFVPLAIDDAANSSFNRMSRSGPPAS